jgi:hypothetical protein
MTEPGRAEPGLEELLDAGGPLWLRADWMQSRRARAALALLGVLATCGVVASRLASQHSGASTQASPLGAATPARAVSPAVSPTAPAAAVLPGFERAGAGVDVQILVTPVGASGPAWLHAGHGQLRVIRLPTDPQGWDVAASPAGVVLHAGPTQRCDVCPGEPTAVYYAATGSPVAHRVGAANDIAAITADHRAIWLSSYRYPDRSVASSTQVVTAREVSLAGRPIGAPVRVPTGYRLAGDVLAQPVHGQLLLVRQVGLDTHYIVWSPRQDRVVAALGRALAVSDTEVAWVSSSCPDAACPVERTDLRTGRTRLTGVPSGRMPIAASYSPDGRRLAVLTVVRRDLIGAGQLDTFLLRRTGTPEYLLSPAQSAVPVMTWVGDSPWLVLASPTAAHATVVDSRDGMRFAVPLPA